MKCTTATHYYHPLTLRSTCTYQHYVLMTSLPFHNLEWKWPICATYHVFSDILIRQRIALPQRWKDILMSIVIVSTISILHFFRCEIVCFVQCIQHTCNIWYMNKNIEQDAVNSNAESSRSETSSRIHHSSCTYQMVYHSQRCVAKRCCRCLSVCVCVKRGCRISQ